MWPHRLPRVVWSAAGCGAGLLVALVLGSHRVGVVALVLAVVGGTSGWWAYDAWARHRDRQRRQRIARQLPMVADLVALAVGAGATPMGALTAAADALPGPLSDEVREAEARVRSGAPVSTALAEMAHWVGLPEFRRLVDSLLLATDLGTPLAEVARAQAADIRSRQRRAWMEAAGRRDVVMLVPIVFLVLPGVVAIALYPGLQSFRMVVP
jgi:tight adherence protein C